MNQNDREGLRGLVDSAEKRFYLSTLPRFYYSEQVQYELSGPIWRGRWWEWLPGWAEPLRDFSFEVAIVAKAMGIERIDLAQHLVEFCGEARENLIYKRVDELYAYPIPSWEIVQLVQEWIFYELRPLLRSYIELNLDGR